MKSASRALASKRSATRPSSTSRHLVVQGTKALTSILRAEAFRASRSMRWGVYRDPRDRWEIPCVPVTEYTWHKRWVAYAMDRHSLPLSMRFGRTVKDALPAGLGGRSGRVSTLGYAGWRVSRCLGRQQGGEDEDHALSASAPGT